MCPRYFVDVLGSPFQISNGDGSVDTYRQYDAWGNVRSEVVGDADQRFGFTGYQADGESGLLYAKARFHDGEVGRFLREDPFEGVGETPPSLHRYLYGYANPTVWVDPSGRIQIGVDTADNIADDREAILDGEVDQGLSGTVLGHSTSRAINAGLLGLLEKGVRAVNFVANLFVVEVLPIGSELRSEAEEELGELADGIENTASQLGRQIVEDPGGTVRTVVELPSSTVRSVLDTTLFGSERDRIELAAQAIEVSLETALVAGTTRRVAVEVRNELGELATLRAPPSTPGKSPLVYRRIRPDDRGVLARGLEAWDPDASLTPEQHVLGEGPTQFLSSSRDIEIPRRLYGGSRSPIVEIDLKKVDEFVDLSDPEVRNFYLERPRA